MEAYTELQMCKCGATVQAQVVWQNWSTEWNTGKPLNIETKTEVRSDCEDPCVPSQNVDFTIEAVEIQESFKATGHHKQNLPLEDKSCCTVENQRRSKYGRKSSYQTTGKVQVGNTARADVGCSRKSYYENRYMTCAKETFQSIMFW